MPSGTKLWWCSGQDHKLIHEVVKVSTGVSCPWHPACPTYDTNKADTTFGGHAIGIPSCLFAGAIACLRLSSDYFILQYSVGDRLFSKMPFSRRHLAFPGMPSFFFLFSEYSFSGVRWQCSKPLNLTFIKDWERVKTTPFYSVLYSAFVIYKETTATELSYFYLCFIFNFSNIKS